MTTPASSNDTILVPIANPETANQLVSTAVDLATDNGLNIELLTVIQVPDQLPLSEGERLIDDERETLEYAAGLVDTENLQVTRRIRFARSIASGICSAATEHDVQTILMGWRGRPRRRDIILGSHLDEVLRNAPCDVLVKRIGETTDLQRILLPIAGGPNTELATAVAGSLARVHEAAIHVLTVQSPTDLQSRQQDSQTTVARVIAGLTGVLMITQEVVDSESVADVILDRSVECDLVVLGATSDSLFRRSLIGSVPEEVGRESTSPVLMVKQYQNLPSRITRLLARLRTNR